MTAVFIAAMVQYRVHQFKKKETPKLKLILLSKHTQKVIFWSLILHTIWEFIQCLFLYDMWDWPFWKATVWMWGAILGDILIVLGLWKATTVLIPSLGFESPGLKGYLTLLILSFLASILLEWVSQFLELWQYTSIMPVVTFFDYEVGLSPVLQITFLPALSIYLATKSKV